MISASALIALLESSKYGLLFVGCFLEGAVIMMTAGALVHLGSIDPLIGFLTLLAADLAADTTWYFIGRQGARRFVTRWGPRFNITQESLEKTEQRFHRHHTTILFVSKLTSGIGFAYATLMTAGMLRVPFGRFIMINAAAGVVWVGALMTIGYYFGSILTLLPLPLQIALAIVSVVGALYVLKYLNQRLARSEW